MALVNGQVIAAADLNAANTNALQVLKVANSPVHLAKLVNLLFPNVTSSTAAGFRTVSFVMADDMYLEDISVAGGDLAGLVSVTISSGALIAPITLTGSVTSPGIVQLSRYYSDTSKPFQVFLRGSTVTVTVSVSDTAGTQSLGVGLLFRSPRRRD